MTPPRIARRCGNFLPLLLLLGCCLAVRLTQGAHILAVLPSVWRSHYIFGKTLMSSLVAAPGHNHTVTLISPHAMRGGGDDGGGEAVPGIREIRIDGLLANWQEMGLSFDVEHIRQKSIMERFTRLIYAGITNADLLLEDGQVKQLLRNDEVSFDLLVVDLFLSDSLLGLAHYYQVPAVVLSPTGSNSWLNELQCNPQSLALDPSNYLPYEESMTLWQRSVNTLMGVFERLSYNFFYSGSQQAIYEKHFLPYFPGDNQTLPHHRDLTKNISLMLLNSDPVLQYPRPFQPNTIEVAGLHLLADEELHLPNSLKTFIEGAPDGVVLFSLGANMRTADMQRDVLNTFLDAFASLQTMRFLLKWELAEDLEACPENVMTTAWYPQQAVLAHPNVRAFITAGGPMSLVEAIDTLTPMLIVPIHPEQEVNAKRMQRRGVALSVQYDQLNYGTVVEALRELTTTRAEDFGRNLREFRHLFRNTNALSPKQRALHYIELVLNTSGAPHLRTHAHHLNFVRSEMLDVMSIIGFGLGLIVAIPFLVTCFTLKRSYRKMQDNQQRLSGGVMAAVAITAPHSPPGSVPTHRRALATRYSYSGSSVTGSASLGDLSVTGPSQRPPKMTNRQYSSSSDSTVSSSASASPKGSYSQLVGQ